MWYTMGRKVIGELYAWNIKLGTREPKNTLHVIEFSRWPSDPLRIDTFFALDSALLLFSW